MPEEKVIYTVTQYIGAINAKLAALSASVQGEVSEMKQAASGHVYFTIKDKDTGHILPCTIWNSKYVLSSVDLENGMELVVKGKPEFYGPFGKLSFIANSIELVGEGALLKAYQKLKMKLEQEGLFAPELKRTIPEYATRIGVITSVHGAVIHDFSKNLGKYGFSVTILDARVEGPESGPDLARAVRAFRNYDIEVLVILRGGGSVQSLAGFDNEALVREIVSFPVPVLAGIGHHQDVPLAALAADAAESTPSLVAELLNETWNAAQYSLAQSERTIVNGFASILGAQSRELDAAFHTIERAVTNLFQIYKDAEQSIAQGMIRMSLELVRTRDGLAKNMRQISSSFTSLTDRCSSQLMQIQRLIESNNPERQLQLGYSIVFASTATSMGGTVVRSPKDLHIGDQIHVRFANGSAEAEIKKIT